MRLLPFLFLLASAVMAGPIPPELATALADFRTEGPKGWSFTQTTESEGKSLVEVFDPAKPDFQRWTLVRKDGHEPTADDIREYREKQTRRTGGQTAPNVKDQINPETCEIVSDDGTSATWRFRLHPGSAEDRSAEHMAASFTLHRPTGTIERVELASFEPFSPMFAVSINEARTVLTYSLPSGDTPSLLQSVSMKVRGKAMWFKSLDSDLSVVYSNYAYAGRR
ncbi:hypothetical protein MASR2M8_13010 [Opitutaceae bacterium]